MLLLLAAPAAAQAIRVVDGDTVQIGVERIRLVNVDAPESWRPHCDRERALGIAAKERLRELLDGGTVTFTPTGVDRYSRTLAYVRVDRADVGEILIQENHALRWKPGPVAKAARLARWCPT